MNSTTIIGRSLSEIRQHFQSPNLSPALVRIAVHEAAHATVSLATGAEVTEVYVRAFDSEGYTGWEGECIWRRYGQSPSDEYTAIAAGAASLDLLDLQIAGDNPWQDGEGDIHELHEHGVSTTDMVDYRERACEILSANTRTLDRIATEILEGPGTLSESDIRAIAKPGMLPDKDSNPQHWTQAQRNALADGLQAMATDPNLPIDLRTKLDALGIKAGTNTVPANIRYSDALEVSQPTGRYWHQTRQEHSNQPLYGYEHRALFKGVGTRELEAAR